MGQKSRINKFLALCGVASRRAAEALISAGRVSVNGEVIADLGRQVDHDLDTVTFDGETVTPASEKIYLLMNKPPLVITSASDPQGRTTVLDILAQNYKEYSEEQMRVFAVGRLDFDTEGALLLTNDGELAHRLTHPKYQIKKIYQALVDGEFTEAHGRKIAKGIPLEDGALGRAAAHKIKSEGAYSLVALTLTEGRKREVKQLLAACEFRTLKLTRVAFAEITAEGLNPGAVRKLTSEEISSLRKQVADSR